MLQSLSDLDSDQSETVDKFLQIAHFKRMFQLQGKSLLRYNNMLWFL